MGAWGTGTFENDFACDFALLVADSSGVAVLEEAFDRVLGAEDAYLESPEGSEAIAAADILARLKGHWGVRDAYSAKVDAWVERADFGSNAGLEDKARRSLDRVLREPSEALELWTETESLDDWLAAVAEVRGRIG